jgi:drug/metabolite transporter (DMT)-like permease
VNFPVTMPNNRKARIYNLPYLLLTLAVFFWSGNFILGRAVRAEVPPIALAFWRWAIASLLMSGVAWRYLRRDWGTVRDHWPILLLLSVIGVAAFNTLVYSGLQSTIALNAFILQSMMPVLIVGMSFVLFREKITRLQAVGVAFSLAGALTIISKADWHALRAVSINHGDLFIFIAVVCYAGYSVLLRKRPAIHPLSFVAVTFSIGSLLLLPLYLAETWAGRPIQFNRTTFLAVGYVAIFPSIVSYLCFNRGVELAGANRAGLFLHLMPVFGSIMAIVFLGEAFEWFHAAGMTLILLGILMATRA